MAGKGATIDVTYEPKFKEQISQFQPPGGVDVICTEQTVIPDNTALLDPDVSPGYGVGDTLIIPPTVQHFNAAEYETTLNQPGNPTVDFQFAYTAPAEHLPAYLPTFRFNLPVASRAPIFTLNGLRFSNLSNLARHMSFIGMSQDEVQTDFTNPSHHDTRIYHVGQTFVHRIPDIESHWHKNEKLYLDCPRSHEELESVKRYMVRTANGNDEFIPFIWKSETYIRDNYEPKTIADITLAAHILNVVAVSPHKEGLRSNDHTWEWVELTVPS